MKHRKLLTDIRHFSGSHTEHLRARYLLVYLQTHSRSQAAKWSGLHKRELYKIIELLADHGSLSDRPRSGRPLTYTSDKLDVAYWLLADAEEGFMTGQGLLDQLVEMGVFGPDADVDTFLRHLARHIKAKGHRLIVNSTKTIFFITAADIMQRVNYAANMLNTLKTQPLDMVIFTDETTLEESPHPKGAVLHTMLPCIVQSNCMHVMAVCCCLACTSQRPCCLSACTCVTITPSLPHERAMAIGQL